MRWPAPDGFYLSDEREAVDVDRVHHWLSDESYWAAGRSRDVVQRSLDASLVISLFEPAGVQVGVARWVSDGATFAWLSDVFLDSSYRGRGLGRVLIATALAHPHVQGLPRRLLATRDAHEFYRSFGFQELAEPSRWMELRSIT
ncbi:MAG: GNAT family N-acetyltransferase [Acidimicrobiales bacterium]